MALRVLVIDEPERARVIQGLLQKKERVVECAAGPAGGPAEAAVREAARSYDVVFVAGPLAAAWPARPEIVGLDGAPRFAENLGLDSAPRERWGELLEQALVRQGARGRMRRHARALATHAFEIAAVNRELKAANVRLARVGELTRRMLKAGGETEVMNELLQGAARLTGSARMVFMAGRKGGLAARMGLGVAAEDLNLFVPCEPAVWRGLAPFAPATSDLGLELAMTRLLGDEFYYLPLGAPGRAYGLLAVAGSPGAADRPALRQFIPTAAHLLRQVRLLRNYRVLSERDSLTGLRNHASLQRSLRLEMKRHQRTERPFSLVLFDIDHFKAVNDTHGHPAGDKVLKIVAGLLTQSSRENDIAARYGGEEFALVLPDTDREGAEKKVAEFLGAVRSLDLGPVGPLTLSAGIATYPADGNAVTALIEAADRALYAAKNGGRDRAMTYAEWLESTLPEAEGDP